MNRRDKHKTIEIGEQWGEWKDYGVNHSTVNKKSSLEKVRELGIRVEVNWQEYTPVESELLKYTHNIECVRIDIIINTMPIDYKDIAYYEWVNRNAPREWKDQEKRMIVKRHGWIKQKDGEETIDLKKMWVARENMIHYIWAALRAGAGNRLKDAG